MASLDKKLQTANRLLVALQSADLGPIETGLERVDCTYRDILIEADAALDRIYFPERGVISILAVYSDGRSMEMATIGREGSTAIQAVFGAKASTFRLMVQVPGTALCLRRNEFDRAIERSPPFRQLMLSHSHAFLEQVLVSGACNGAHTIKQRLARWLLMMWDRNDDDTLPVTQDLMAEMLGVQRPTVTNAARAMHEDGLIRLERKRVTLLDRDGLGNASCECYQQVRTRTANLLPKTYVK